jgi:hypothetical protein
MKHGAGGQHRWGGPAGGASTGGRGQQVGPAWARKDQARGSSTGALCTRFTLILIKSVRVLTNIDKHIFSSNIEE